MDAHGGWSIQQQLAGQLDLLPHMLHAKPNTISAVPLNASCALSLVFCLLL
jgi:hypothetical protein